MKLKWHNLNNAKIGNDSYKFTHTTLEMTLESEHRDKYNIARHSIILSLVEV